jgi:hypothetical protein
MCMACEEMQLYYAYLDAVEAEEKRKAQPWQCEVTLFPQADVPGVTAERSSAAPRMAPAASKFACDAPE